MTLQELAIIILLIVVLTLLNAFFVAAEMALARVRRTRIDELAEKGGTLARKVQIYLDDPDTFITGGQLGITLAMLIVGAVGEQAFAERLSHWLADIGPGLSWSPDLILTGQVICYTLVFTITAFLQTVWGEILPKTLTFNRAEQVILWTIYPMHFWCLLTKPLLIVMNNVVRYTLKLFKISDPHGHHLVHSEDELKMLVSASHEEGVLEEGEEEMIHSVFEFADTVASEIMTPRRDMIVMAADQPVSDMVDLALKHGHSRIPIYEEGIDSIFGLIHIRDGMRAYVEGKEKLPVRELARPILIVPENKGLQDLLTEFKKTKTHMAIVVDEHGGTEGVVTFEDLLEELVGDIADEHDIVEEMILESEEGTIIDARITLEEVNEMLDLAIEDEQFNTLGGHVFGQLGHEPSVGDEVEAGDYTLRIEEADRHRIIKLKLIRKDPDEQEDDEDGAGTIAEESPNGGSSKKHKAARGEDSVSSLEASS